MRTIDIDTKPKKERKPRGGYRPNAGRKSRYTLATERIVANLPAEFRAAIETKHGTITAALEAIAIAAEPSLTKYIKKD